MRTKAVVSLFGLLLIGIVASRLTWRPLGFDSPPSVEVTFVRYEYDAIVLRATNRTDAVHIVFEPSLSNLTFSSFQHVFLPHSGFEFSSTCRKIDPASLPPQIDFPYFRVRSRSHQRIVRFLKKIGIDIAATNLAMSVKLPPVTPIPTAP